MKLICCRNSSTILLSCLLSPYNKKGDLMKNKKKIILICSDGGHLAQILELEKMFLRYDYLIVTEKTPATAPLKEKFNIRYLKSRPEGSKRSLRFIYTIFLNLILSFRMLLTHFPKAIITTGSHTAEKASHRIRKTLYRREIIGRYHCAKRVYKVFIAFFQNVSLC